MTLQFTMRVNDKHLASVTITRVETAEDGRSPHTYRWHVCGDPYDDRECVNGEIRHHERHGAMQLAASVLTAYDQKRNRR